jgi:plastocyanin
MATTHKVITVSEASGAMFFKDVTSSTPETTIVVGDSIEWSAPDDDHSVVSDNKPPFDTLTPPLSDGLDLGTKFTRQFSTAGTYGYHCGIHGGDSTTKTDMYGIIHVNSADGA